MFFSSKENRIKTKGAEKEEVLAAIAAMEERCDRLSQLWATAPGAGAEGLASASLPHAPTMKAPASAAAASAAASAPTVGTAGRAGTGSIGIDIEMDLGAELPAELESFLSSVTDQAAGDLREMLPL